MRKISNFAAVAALVLAFTGCAKEFGGDALPGRIVNREFTAYFDAASTKTSLAEKNAVLWEAGDRIDYFYDSAEQVLSMEVENSGSSVTVSAQMTANDTWLTAVYGASSVTKGESGDFFTLTGVVPSEQNGLFPSAHVSVAHISGDALNSGELPFKNLTSLVKFSITREDVVKAVFLSNDGSPISCGDSGFAIVRFSDSGMPEASAGQEYSASITLNLKGAGEYYISLLPQTLASGFTLKCYNAEGVRVGVAKYEQALEIPRSAIMNLGNLDPRLVEATDLSAEETANCYIVPSSGEYKFVAGVKGNADGRVSDDGETVRPFTAVDGIPYDAVVLWETYGMTVAPKEGDVVQDVRLEDGYVYFSAIADGSALIAVRDEEKKILWSWHIWVWNGFSNSAYTQNYYGGARMMDRNLGAKTNTATSTQDKTCWGLLYQWGRKDPFRGASSATITHALTGVDWTWMMSTEETGTVDYAVKHPMTYIYYTDSEGARDWMYVKDDTLWGYDKDGTYHKTIYDPCPPGWRIPDKDVWSKALGQETTMYKSHETGVDGQDMNGYLGDATIYYPFTGYRDGTSSYYVTNQGWYGHWWAAGTSGNYASVFSVFYTNQVRPVNAGSRSFGYNVRCQADFVVKPVKVQGVLLSDQSLELQRNHQARLSAIVLPDDAANKAVTWSISQDNPEVVAAILEVDADNAACTITAKNIGSCTVTVSSVEDPSKSASCTINVVEGTTVDLSADGTANSYIVSQPGEYVFNATYKGNSTERIEGAPVRARVLWESYGTSSFDSYAPVVRLSEDALSVVSSGNTTEYFVTFEIPASMSDGNAVIALVDENNTILWSWHIWACRNFDPAESAQTYRNQTVVMDRNLGATSTAPGNVRSVGLFYQWGRKDPFIGPDGISSSYLAASSVVWPSSVQTSSVSGTINYVTKFPTTFVSTSGIGDWLQPSDATIWGNGAAKTKYDPCPVGWRVPQGGDNGLWAGAAAGKTLPTTPDVVNRGVDFTGVFANEDQGTVWYPVSGYRNWTSGNMGGEGQYAHYLSATPYTNAKRACSLYITFNPATSVMDIQVSSSSSKSVGGNIRCVKE